MGGWQPHPPTSKSIVMTVTQSLRNKIAQLKSDLVSAEQELAHRVSTCHHGWSKPEAAHIYRKGYQVDGDPPGTMGIDWRGPFWVEAKTTKRWKRTCEHCGEIQYTSDTTKHVTEEPKF